MRQSDKRENTIVGIMVFVVFFFILALLALFSFLSEAKGFDFEEEEVDRQEMMYNQTVRTVVRISVSSGNVGSGVVIASHDGITTILSNYHVTVNEEWLKVELDGTFYDAELVKWSEEKDLSLVVIDATAEYVVHVHEVNNIRVFDEIIVVGAGAGLLPYPSMGIISNPVSRGEMIQGSVAVVGGKSGGGVFIRHGGHFALIGIIRAQGLQPVVSPMGMQQRIPVNNVMFAIPMSTVTAFLAE